MNKAIILNYIDTIKEERLPIKALFSSYSRNEADKNSDIDILVESIKLKEIQNEMSSFLGVSVDLANSTGIGKTAKKSILDRAIYV